MRMPVALVVFVGTACAAGADEPSEAVAKQKAAAAAKLTSARLKAAHVETDDLLVYGTLPEERLRPLATVLQRSHTVAEKALRYDEKERPWTGKLTVFVVTGSRPYKTFVLDALKRIPDSRETSAMDLRGESPFLVLGTDSEKPADRQLAAEGAARVADTLLSRKAGVGRSSIQFGLPDWLREGFGRAIALRTEGTGSRLAEHRSKVRSLFNRSRGSAFVTSAVWGDATNPQSELLGTSLVEYLAFGPAADRFPAFLAGFKPQDENSTPTVAGVLTGLEWKVEELETGWRTWVLKGK